MKSCWGCALDWVAGWHPDDVGTFQNQDGEDVDLCPDCAEEVVNHEDGTVRT